MNKILGFDVFGVELPEAVGDILSPKMYIGDQPAAFQEGDILRYGGFHDMAMGIIIAAERPGEGEFAENPDGSCRCFLLCTAVELPKFIMLNIFATVAAIIAYSSGLALEVIEVSKFDDRGPKKFPTKLRFIKKR